MNENCIPATGEHKLPSRNDRDGDVASYVPPRIEKEQRLAEVTGNGPITG